MSLLYAFLFLILEAVPDFHKSSAQKRLLLEHFIVSRLGGGLLPPGTGESNPTHGDLLQCNLSVTAGQERDSDVSASNPQPRPRMCCQLTPWGRGRGTQDRASR